VDNYVENCDPPTQRGQAAPKESNSLRRLFNGGSPVGWEACAGGRHVEVRSELPLPRGLRMPISDFSRPQGLRCLSCASSYTAAYEDAP
jgi:hypothetical protein